MRLSPVANSCRVLTGMPVARVRGSRVHTVEVRERSGGTVVLLQATESVGRRVVAGMSCAAHVCARVGVVRPIDGVARVVEGVRAAEAVVVNVAVFAVVALAVVVAAPHLDRESQQRRHRGHGPVHRASIHAAVLR